MKIRVKIQNDEAVKVNVAGEAIGSLADPYPGPYSATPTQSTQVFPTSGLSMSDNFTVNPIPAKYGDATGKTVFAAGMGEGLTAIGYNSQTGAAVNITGTAVYRTIEDITSIEVEGLMWASSIIGMGEEFFAWGQFTSNGQTFYNMSFRQVFNPITMRQWFVMMYGDDPSEPIGEGTVVYDQLSGWVSEAYRIVDTENQNIENFMVEHGGGTSKALVTTAPDGIYLEPVDMLLPVQEVAASYTPGSQTITIPAAGKYVEDDIVINPIPSNYGLITYNGYELVVS